MKEWRKPEYPEKTLGDDLQIMVFYAQLTFKEMFGSEFFPWYLRPADGQRRV